MHIHELADHCTFSEVAIGGTLPATEEYRAFLKRLHPKQILNMRISVENLITDEAVQGVKYTSFCDMITKVYHKTERGIFYGKYV